MKHALGEQEFRKLSSALSPELLVSLNFAPLHYKIRLSSGNKPAYEFEFFGPYHKHIQDLLIVQDVSGHSQVIILDDNDAKIWEEQLRKHPDQTKGKRIALYNISLNQIYRESSQLVEINSQVKKLIVEAAFLSGQVNYPHAEQGTLKKFLEDSDAKTMLNLFKKYILAYRRDSQKAFGGSDLEKIFIEILGSAD